MRRPPLGQHFLRDRRFVDLAIEAAHLVPHDVVLEVGPGKGILTRALASMVATVHAIEIDNALADALAGTLPPNVHITVGDAVQAAWPNFTAVVSNLPYQISSPFLFRLLSDPPGGSAPQTPPFRVAVLLLQKEFAERLVAKVGTGEYGRLSVNAQRRAAIEIVARVPPGAFDPPPQVESALVRLVPRPPAFEVPANFDAVVERAFAQRRKKVRNTLGVTDPRFADKRPEELTPEEFALVARSV